MLFGSTQQIFACRLVSDPGHCYDEFMPPLLALNMPLFLGSPSQHMTLPSTWLPKSETYESTLIPSLSHHSLSISPWSLSFYLSLECVHFFPVPHPGCSHKHLSCGLLQYSKCSPCPQARPSLIHPIHMVFLKCQSGGISLSRLTSFSGLSGFWERQEVAFRGALLRPPCVLEFHLCHSPACLTFSKLLKHSLQFSHL